VTKSQRRTIARSKMLQTLQETHPERCRAELARLLCVWLGEARRLARNRSLSLAGALIEIASRYGLRREIELEVIYAVQHELRGPGFISRSIRSLGEASHPDVIQLFEERYGRSRA
jgi:hypothetical protein